MSRRMNAGLQKYSIESMLTKHGVSTEMYDVHSHMDRTLRLHENVKEIQKQHGINQGSHRQDRLQDFRQVPVPETHHGYLEDLARHAMPPGKRFVHHPGGRTTIYYERRSNRSDVPGTRL
jgi:hypothetical protein